MAFVAGAIKGTISLDASKWQSGLALAVRGLTAFATAAGAAFSKAAYDANEYHVALSRAAVVAQGTDISMKSLGQTMLKVNPAFGSATSLMRGYELAVSSGARTHKEAMDTVISASKFAIAHTTEHATAVDMITTLMNSYSIASEKAALSTKKIVDIMDAVIAYGKADAPGLAKNLGQLAPMLGQLDIPFEQVGAAIAVMTNNGVSASRTMTQLRALLSSFLKPAPELERVFQDLFASTGKYYETSADFVKQEGLTGVFKLLNSASAEQSDRLAKMLPNMRALMGAYSMAGGALDQYTYYLKEMEASEGRIDSSFALKEKTLQTVQNLYKNISSIFGEPIWVAIKGYVDKINDAWADMVDYLTGPGRRGLFDFAISVNTMLGNTAIAIIRAADSAMNAMKPLLRVLEGAGKLMALSAATTALEQSMARVDFGDALGINREFSAIDALLKKQVALRKYLTDTIRLQRGQKLPDFINEIEALKKSGATLQEMDAKVKIRSGQVLQSYKEFLVATANTPEDARYALVDYYDELSGTARSKASTFIDVIEKTMKDVNIALGRVSFGPAFARSGKTAKDFGKTLFEETEEIDVLVPQINWVGGGDSSDFVNQSVKMYTSAQDVIMARIEKNVASKDTVKSLSFSGMMGLESKNFGKIAAVTYGDAGKRAGEAFILNLEKQLLKQHTIMTAVSQVISLIASAAQAILDKFKMFSDLHFEAKISKINAELARTKKALGDINDTITKLEKTSSEWEDKIKDISEQLGLAVTGEKTLQELKDEHQELVDFMEKKYGLQLAGLQEFKDGEYAIALAAYNGSLALMSAEDQALIKSSGLEIDTKTTQLQSDLAFAKSQKAISDEKIDQKKKEADDLIAIEDALNKKLDGQRKKQFENDKKFSIAKVWIDTATAIAGYWATYSKVYGGWAIAAALSTAATGMGVAQTALISQQEYVPSYASGTAEHGGGAALVGEQGPEIVNLPRGTSVIPNARTMSMMGSGAKNGSGDSFIFNFNNPTIDSRERMNDLVNRVEKEIGQRMRGRVA